MGIFLWSVAIVGMFVSLVNLYAKVRITAILPIQYLGLRQLFMGRNIWLSVTLPLLSTILLFIFQHWIFTLGIFLSTFFYLYETLGGISEIKKRSDLLKMSNEEAVTYDIERSITETERYPIKTMIPGICGVIGKVITVFGVAIIMTLSDSQTIWSWKLLMFIVAGFICVSIANSIIGGIVNLLASMFRRDVT